MEFILEYIYIYFFSALIASADSCSFFFLSSISHHHHHHLPFFHLYVISCDLSSQGHQRTSVGMCGVSMDECGCVTQWQKFFKIGKKDIHSVSILNITFSGIFVPIFMSENMSFRNFLIIWKLTDFYLVNGCFLEWF